MRFLVYTLGTFAVPCTWFALWGTMASLSAPTNDSQHFMIPFIEVVSVGVSNSYMGIYVR